MKFTKEDLNFEVPTVKEFLLNTPNEKVATRASYVKQIWLPSPKGYLTIVTEFYKLFLHRNSAMGKWFIEISKTLEKSEPCLLLRCSDLTGMSFDVDPVENTKCIWVAMGDPVKGYKASDFSPSTKKKRKSSGAPSSSQDALEGASSLSNDR